MTDSAHRGSPSDPNQYRGTQYYPGYTDPAYAGGYPYGPTYSAAPAPSSASPTEPLPPYWTQTYGQVPPGLRPPEPPPPGPPKSPRWLWVAAIAAVLLVVGLVIALVIANSAAKKQTVVAPLPAMPSPSTTTTTRPLIPVLPLPTVPALPTVPPTTTESTTPGETEPVVYEVTGTGRAINITYVDTGDMMQTEFNVALPWHKQVDLPKPAADSASVTVINVGRDITCSITVSGVQVRQRTGAGLTICSASS
jgi:Mycobacterium membrane protein